MSITQRSGKKTVSGWTLTKAEQITPYPISEINQMYLVGHIGCPKNLWGAKVIEKANQSIREHRLREFLSYYEYWLDDESIPRYREIIERYKEEHSLADK